MILDATAGNRHIWGKNKYPEGVIFMDKEPNLKITPDVLATWQHSPFRADVFDCIIFDPPFYTNAPPWFTDLEEKRQNMKKRKEMRGLNRWYGYPFKTKGEMVRELYKAQKEFARLTSRLCLKWCDIEISVDRILTIFDNWIPIFVQKYIDPNKVSKSKTTVWWVKMVRRGGV